MRGPVPSREARSSVSAPQAYRRRRPAPPPTFRMPLPRFLTVASLLVQAGAALIIACVFVGLKRRYWRPFLSHWTWSWLALAVYATLRAAALFLGFDRTFDYPP